MIRESMQMIENPWKTGGDNSNLDDLMMRFEDYFELSDSEGSSVQRG